MTKRHALNVVWKYPHRLKGENLEVQNETIKRVLEERGKTVYATLTGNGAIIVHNGIIKLIGKIQSCLP